MERMWPSTWRQAASLLHLLCFFIWKLVCHLRAFRLPLSKHFSNRFTPVLKPWSYHISIDSHLDVHIILLRGHVFEKHHTISQSVQTIMNTTPCVIQKTAGLLVLAEALAGLFMDNTAKLWGQNKGLTMPRDWWNTWVWSRVWRRFSMPNRSNCLLYSAPT